MADAKDTITATAQDAPVATGGTLPVSGTEPSKTPRFQAPAEGTTPPAAAPDFQALTGMAKETFERQRADLAKAASERDALRKQLDDIEAARLAEQGKYKELYEKEQTSRKQAEGRMRSQLLRAEVRAYAVAEGILDPDMADLIPTKDVKVGEDGSFEGIKEVIAAHREAKAAWYRSAQAAPATQTPAPNTGSGGAPPSATAPSAADVSRMSREEYARYKKDFLTKLRVVR